MTILTKSSTTGGVAAFGLAALLLVSAPGAFAAPESAGEPGPAEGVVAMVHGQPIMMAEWQAAFRESAPRKLYHVDASPDRVAELGREVLDELIDRRLVVREAKRRGIQPDPAAVDEQVAAYEKQYAGSEQWASMRERVLPNLREFLGGETLVSQLEAQVKVVPDPTEEELLAYYQSNLDAFTEPVRQRVSVIMLQVDPSATTETWKAARDEAARLKEMLLKGADFAELAKLHSSDRSAAEGGDMGYLHEGMLAQEAEDVLAKLSPGEISDPVQILQGVALLKLVERSEQTVHPLDRVRERAVQLYKREQGEKRWAELMQTLRASPDVKVLVSFESSGAAPGK